MAQLSPSFLGDKAPLGIAMVSKSVRESVISKKLETTSVQSVANVPSVSSLSIDIGKLQRLNSLLELSSR